MSYGEPKEANILSIVFEAPAEVGNRIWLKVCSLPAYIEYQAMRFTVDTIRTDKTEVINWLADYATNMQRLYASLVKQINAIVVEELAKEHE